jgi:hypothetical protein
MGITTYLTDWLLGGGAGAPKRLRRGGYEGVWRGLLQGLDQRLTDLDAVAARGMILECPDADLDGHLRNTGDRRMCGEGDAAVRAYLADRWTAYKQAGTTEGLLRQLARSGLQNVIIVRELDLRHGGIAGAFGGNIGYFFLVVPPPSPFSGQFPPTWDGGGSWDGGGVWNGLPQGFIDCLRSAIRRWKPSGHSCRYIVAGTDNTFSWNPVTFTAAGSFEVYPVSEAWEWVGGLHPFYSYDYATP